MTRAIITAGAGGVGKTTLSAAIAVSLARQGARTIVLTIDPARRLADALSVEGLGDEPEPVAAEPLLSAAMLDVSASWEAIIHRYADPDVADRLLVNPYFRAIADRFPAAQAYAAGERMATLIESGKYDVIVIDTPPSEGGIDFFLAPARTGDLVSGRLLRWLTGSHLPGRNLLYRVTARPMLRLADTVLGGPMLADVADFLIDLRTMYDQLSNRSKTIERHLRGATTIIATTADPTPLREVGRFFEKLAGMRITPEAVLFNQTLPIAWIEASGAPDIGTRSVPADVRVNLQRWASEARRQRDASEELAARFGVEVHEIPWSVPPPETLDDLASLVDSVEVARWLG